MITGRYNALKYTIYVDGDPVYTAGNSQFDSQGYVSASVGVGLSQMRSFCLVSVEHNARWDEGQEFGGVTYQEDF